MIHREIHHGGPAARHKDSFVYSLHKGPGVLRIPLPFALFALPGAGPVLLGKGS